MINYSCLMENEFSTWLIDELKKRDWNQSDLALRSGISQGAISKVLLGQRNPGIDFCNGIAKALRVPKTRVMELAGLLPRKNGEIQEADDLIVLFNSLSNNSKKLLMEFALYLSLKDDGPAK